MFNAAWMNKFPQGFFTKIKNKIHEGIVNVIMSIAHYMWTVVWQDRDFQFSFICSILTLYINSLNSNFASILHETNIDIRRTTTANFELILCDKSLQRYFSLWTKNQIFFCEKEKERKHLRVMKLEAKKVKTQPLNIKISDQYNICKLLCERGMIRMVI